MFQWPQWNFSIFRTAGIFTGRVSSRPPIGYSCRMKRSRSNDPLQAIPNVGPSIAADLRRMGIDSPDQLKGQDGYELYRRLCAKDRTRHDPCVVDVMLAAVHFMDTGESKKWWEFTAQRKTNTHLWMPD